MDINQYRRNYLSSGRSAFETAVSTTDLYTACADRRKLGRRAHHFNTKLTVQPKPTNQRSSGRCWLFAALNMVRNRMMVEKKLDSGFQLSQNHLFFWDKFERANYFLRKEVELSKKDNMGKEGEKVPDRLWDELYKTPLQDGGQWTMVVNLVKKYGLVPQSVYRDSHHSTHTLLKTWVPSRLLCNGMPASAMIVRTPRYSQEVSRNRRLSSSGNSLSRST